MSRRANDERRAAGGARRRMLLSLVLIALLSYAGWCAIVYVKQDGLIFPAEFARMGAEEPWDSRTVVLTIPTSPEHEALGWLLPAGNASEGEPSPLLVFFHGNAEVINNQRDLATVYQRRGWNVLLVEYRGYGLASGSPSQDGIVADSLALIDRAVARDEVDGSRLVFHGRSLGGAIAVQVADVRRPQALILESSFTHLGAFASSYGVPSFLLKHPFDTRALLPALGCPVLLFHGAEDTIIPPSHSEALAELSPDATLVLLEGAGHNTMPGPGNDALYWRAIEDLLQPLDR